MSYQSPLMDLARKRPGYGPLEDHNKKCSGKNRRCGDFLELFLLVSEGETIKDMSYTGDCCALCIASASTMVKLLKGQPVGMLQIYFQKLERVLNSKPGNVLNDAEVFEVFKPWSKQSTRHGCILLPWQILLEELPKV